MDEDTYRDLLCASFSASSTKDLTRGQARALLAHLDGGPLPVATGGASFKQVGLLRHLLGLCGMQGDTALDYVRARFVTRAIRRLEDLDSREANQAIKGAKRWLAVEQAKTRSGRSV